MKKVLKSIMYATIVVVAIGIFLGGFCWLALHHPVILISLVGAVIFLMIAQSFYDSID